MLGEPFVHNIRVRTFQILLVACAIQQNNIIVSLEGMGGGDGRRLVVVLHPILHRHHFLINCKFVLSFKEFGLHTYIHVHVILGMKYIIKYEHTCTDTQCKHNCYTCTCTHDN